MTCDQAAHYLRFWLSVDAIVCTLLGVSVLAAAVLLMLRRYARLWAGVPPWMWARQTLEDFDQHPRTVEELKREHDGG